MLEIGLIIQVQNIAVPLHGRAGHPRIHLHQIIQELLEFVKHVELGLEDSQIQISIIGLTLRRFVL
jgi:hypothetical protein